MASLDPPTPTLKRELSDEGRRLLQEALQTDVGFGGGDAPAAAADPHRDHAVQMFEGEVSTRNTQHATRNTQHATRNTQHATRNTPPPLLSVG